ncbi:50S ribosomal protein L32 [Nocardioides sp. SYSU DS0651]
MAVPQRRTSRSRTRHRRSQWRAGVPHAGIAVSNEQDPRLKARQG